MLRDQQILFTLTVATVRSTFAESGLREPGDAEILRIGDALMDDMDFGACVRAAVKRHIPDVTDTGQ